MLHLARPPRRWPVMADHTCSGGNISHRTFRPKLAWLGKRYPNMGAEGCTASPTVSGLYIRVVLSLVVFASLLVCNQNILKN